MRSRVAGIVAVVLPLAGCASAMPLMSGASTVRHERIGVTAGGSAAVPVGGARTDRSEGSLAHAASSGGVVPVAGARYGVAPHWDVGLFVAGTDFRVEARREIVLDDASTRPAILLGAGLTAGYVDDDGLGNGHPASGARYGVEIPAVWAVEFGAVYDVWLGVRLAAEHVQGRFVVAPPAAGGTAGTADANATSLRAGAVIGLGAGFRRLHAELELTAYYQAWVGANAGSGLGNGLVLVPAFALRFR